MRSFILGVIVTLLIFTLVGYVAVSQGLVPANADGRPPKIEIWAAKTSLHATLRRDAPKGAAPIPATDANLVAGIKLYGQNCAVCHGASTSKWETASNIATGLYQKAPQLADDGVEDDPVGVTYWKIAHGIRFTGMPAFGAHLSDTQIWQMSLFLNKMDKLPPAVQKVWAKVQATPAPV